MSEITPLRGRLAPILGDRLDALWGRFREDEPDGDATLFVARLRRDGHLTDDEVCEVFLRGEVTITLSDATSGAASEKPASTRYTELSRLGAGAMGEVVLATDPELRRQVALKRLHPHLTRDPALIRRFRTEAQITAQLDHPAIMPVFSFEVEADGTLAYAMKLIRGRTLDDVLHEARVAHQEGALPDGLSLRARLEIFLAVCDAMAYAHARGVIHRDLKPENIMVGAFHEVTVMDWGIAKLASNPDDPASSLDAGAGGPGDRTRVGVAIGTPCYMSPEQAQGQNPTLDARSDQYALGLMLHEIVSLRRANMAEDVRVIVRRAQQGTRDALRPYSKLETVPRELRAIIGKACAKRPDDRYADVSALADDVRRYLRDDAVLAAPDTLAQRIHRWSGRNRTLLLGGVAAVALLGAAATTTAVIVGAAALGVQYVVAEQTREASERVLARVAAQGQAMDAALMRYEALLTGMSYAAEESLQRQVDRRTRHLSRDFDQPGGAPADLADSPRYGGPVSLDHAALHVPDAVDAAAVDPVLDRLVSVHPWMARALLDSAHTDAASTSRARQQVARTTGLPVVWALIATEAGPMAILPGKGGIPGHIDPRTRPWYRGALTHRGVFWSKPYVDMGGMGLLVSASLALRDRDGGTLGVASFDLDIQHLVRDLMAPGDLVPAGAAAYLIADDGVIFLDSTRPPDAASTRGLDPELWAEVSASGKTGQRQVGGNLVTWVRLSVAPWTYVVVGPTDAMLDG